MFANHEGKEFRQRGRMHGLHVHGAAVIALWGIAACWVAFEVIIPPHRTEQLLWRASGALTLTAAASSTMIMWYLARVQIEPANDERRAFRIGYQAGYHDAAQGSEPGPGVLYLLPNPCDEATSRTGTG